MLRIEGLTKRFGDRNAVDTVTLTVPKGEMVGVIGPSGAGKSTLLRMLNRLTEPTAGQIICEEQDVTGLKGASLRRWRRDTAMIFQQFNLVGRLDVLTNVLLGRLNHRSAALTLVKSFSEDDKVRAIAALERLDMGHLLAQRAETLSGGQQQRVAIARALVYEPRILLMDEPLGALDKKLREDLQDELRQLHRRLGITIVYVTHDQEEAMRLSQRIAIFSHGKIVGLGSGFDLYQNPPNAFVASFLGNSNFLKLKAQGNAAASFEGQSLSIRLTGGLRSEQDVLLMVRPEKALALSVEQAAGQPLAAGWNEVSAIVGEVLFLGESQTCSVKTLGGTSMTVKALSAAGMPLKAGDPVRVRWATADACVYAEWAESDLNKAAGAH